jgi:hypothetical protein
LAFAGAALAAAAIVVGVVLSSGESGGARIVHASVSAPTGSAVLRVASGHAELLVHGLPAASPGRIYEVWLKRPGRPPVPTSALFDVTSTGAAMVDVPGDVNGVGEVLVTSERRGGSAVPTRAPVIVARLT